jgi:hypothetical protein
MLILAARGAAAFRRAEAIALCLYLAIAGWVSLHHEAWTDEAQAWLLARDNSLPDLLFKRLHYEGTPGLWHLLLWVLCRLHFSYGAMHWATVLAGGAAAFVLLRSSPFPLAVRLLLPFSFALAYQTPIVARSYSLVPLLAFAICVELDPGKRRPVRLALLIGLLINTSLLSVFFGLGFAAFYVALQCRADHRPPARTLAAAGALLVAMCLFAVYTALPAPDVSVGQARALAANAKIAHALAAITGVTAGCPARLPTERGEASSAPAPGYQYMAWNLAQRRAGETRPGGRLAGALHLASLAFFPVSSFNLLALAFYAMLLTWQARNGALAASLPLLAVIVGGKLLPFNEHHTALVWTAVVVALWLSWRHVPPERAHWLDMVFYTVLVAVLIEQIAWTGFAALYDLGHPFDGSLDAARFLAADSGARTVAGFNYHSVGVQAYAPQKLYYNQPTTYWSWSCSGDSDAHLAEVLQQHPDLVLVGESYDGDVSWRNQIVKEKPAWARNDQDGIEAYVADHGYAPIRRFCGLQPAHFGFSEQTCEVIYAPIGQSPAR